MARKKATKKVEEKTPTNISREYFRKDGVEMVKITSFVDKKKVKEEIIPSSEE